MYLHSIVRYEDFDDPYTLCEKIFGYIYDIRNNDTMIPNSNIYYRTAISQVIYF